MPQSTQSIRIIPDVVLYNTTCYGIITNYTHRMCKFILYTQPSEYNVIHTRCCIIRLYNIECITAYGVIRTSNV